MRDDGTKEALEEAPRITSTQMTRQPSFITDTVMRDELLVIQRHGRDFAVLLDIDTFRRLLAQAAASEEETG
jgi:hypothetical protein